VSKTVLIVLAVAVVVSVFWLVPLLAAFFVGANLAERGFQANSRVITTSDQMLQELLTLKR